MDVALGRGALRVAARRLARGALACLVVALAAPAAARSLEVYCTHDPDVCSAVAAQFTRETGVAVNIVRKPTGEAYAQIRSERDNPRADLWYGGTFDAFIQGSAEGLFEPYRSPRLSEQHAWSVRATEALGHQASAIYQILIGFGINREVLARKSLPAPRCWADLARPEYRNEVETSNPVTSGTAYTILIGLVSLLGEDPAFDYLKRLHRNVVRYTTSGTAQGKSVGMGEVGVGVSFVHEFLVEQARGYPIDIAIPCEGTGYALGGMAIIRGAKDPELARRFYDWALGREAQGLANRAGSFLLPSNRSAEVHPLAARYSGAKLVDIDFTRLSQPAEKKRVLARWEREVAGAR